MASFLLSFGGSGRAMRLADHGTHCRAEAGAGDLIFFRGAMIDGRGLVHGGFHPFCAFCALVHRMNVPCRSDLPHDVD